MSAHSVLVVGGSLAGLATAQSLRDQGHQGPITVIGDEIHRPYDRPPLSKGFLAGTTTVDDLALEGDDALADVDWLLGRRAVSLDVATRSVTLDDDVSVFADAIVVATGARARTLPAHLGGGLGGVHTLRTLEDALALRADLVPGARLVLVGAGFVGAEIASTARNLGLDVTLVEAAPTPLAGPLGAEVGAIVAGLHQANGVPLLCGAPVDALVGEERVTGVQLADGRLLPADVVVLGIGSIAATEWLTGSGLALEAGGVSCDATGWTGAPGIYAVGDAAAWWDPALGRRRRVEHWTDARVRPTRTAATLLGDDSGGATFDVPLPAPYFWSQQYSTQVQFAGRLYGDEVVSIEAGSPETCDVLAVYRRAGWETPTAVLGMGQPRLFGRARRTLATADVLSAAVSA